MATKDWKKKVGKNKWEKLGEITPSGLRYTSSYIEVKFHDGKKLHPIFFSSKYTLHSNFWYIDKYGIYGNSRHVLGNFQFPDKKEAIAYAKAYMRKN